MPPGAGVGGLKDLAEFLVDLADQHPAEDRFCDALVECDPDFSAPVARRLFRTIAAVRPPDPRRVKGLPPLPGPAGGPSPRSATPTGQNPDFTAAEEFVKRAMAADRRPSDRDRLVKSEKPSRAEREKDEGDRVRRRSEADDPKRGRDSRATGRRSPSRKRRRASRDSSSRGSASSSSSDDATRRAAKKPPGSEGPRDPDHRPGAPPRDSRRSQGRRQSRSPRQTADPRGSVGPPKRPRDTHAAEDRLLPKLEPSAADLWEEAQLRAAGRLAPQSAEPRDSGGAFTEAWRDDVNVDVIVQYRTPRFLVGLLADTGRPPSPPRITRNPDGSLQRAAMQHADRMRERRAQERRSAPEPETEEAGGEAIVPRLRPKESARSLSEQRKALPIHQLRQQLMNAVQEYQILVIIGETGSGKTTQITQYLREEGYAPRGLRIACTQPRRVAAVTVAKRVAQEVGCRVGAQVGYAIRFEDCTSSATKIKYMTDGLLLREALVDPELASYSAIILDEAHERVLNTDVLFGLLKALAARRPDLKLLVTSATLDAAKFSAYFHHCPVFTIPGRTYPVELLYTKQPEADFLDGAVTAALQVHANEPPAGDILVFLTGQDEIELACQRLKALWRAHTQQGETARLPDLVVLPIYSSLPPEQQHRIFEPPPPRSRKVIVATNIAETSVTIDGVGYVIDCGFVKQKMYDPKLGIESLTVTPISKAAAKQRAGRAGRTGPGKCYRLYTEAAWAAEMLPDPLPELRRANLGNVVLTLKAMGIADLLQFDFLDPPDPRSLVEAMAMLHGLGALDDDGGLTAAGRQMAEFPLEPMLARTLIAACELGCAAEVLTITAMLSAGNVFFRPKAKQLEADACKAQFTHPDGDHATYLSVYRRWERAHYASSWCYSNFVNLRVMLQARDVRGQLSDLLRRFKLPLDSSGVAPHLVAKAFCSGYFLRVARRARDGYVTLSASNAAVYVHPSSVFFNSPEAPAWVVYHEVVLTSREYMRDVLAVNPRWLPEVAPGYFALRGLAALPGPAKDRTLRFFSPWDSYATPSTPSAGLDSGPGAAS